jgi:hypothetical protein
LSSDGTSGTLSPTTGSDLTSSATGAALSASGAAKSRPSCCSGVTALRALVTTGAAVPVALATIGSVADATFETGRAPVNCEVPTATSRSKPGTAFWPSGVPNALLPKWTGTATEPSSGEAGLSGFTSSSAEAMPVPSISKPPVTSAV